MKIIFADHGKPVADALGHVFALAESGVEIHCGDIFDHKAEAIVSPANSFGFMDGGIDLAYSKHFGWGLQDTLQEKIRDEFDGELLVGQATAVPTGSDEIPWCISAPTMRVPMSIIGTVNAYLAFRAALRVAKAEGYESILCPGLGTSVGKLPPEVAAAQMFIAYSEVVRGLIFDQPGLKAKYNQHLMISRGFAFF